jgi:hypothetical protein
LRTRPQHLIFATNQGDAIRRCKNDIAFRKIFGNENRKETLISFVNAVLDFHGDQRIVGVAILNPYQLPKLECLLKKLPN